jgi:hypothetical protein
VTLGKESNNSFNVVRYATSKQVVGGFTELLKYAERNLSPNQFIAVADHCVSDGSLYSANGFIGDKKIPPDYCYVVKAERRPKSEYSPKRFKEDPNLQWEDGLTEKELADLNGIPRI